MDTNERSPEFAIVGGGICGLTLAIAMIRRGLIVKIYEQAAQFGEVGAGVAFGPNATKALNACSPDLLEAFNKVATRNQSSEKQKSWFDWVDGFHSQNGEGAKWCFRLENEQGANSVHRARFLDEMVKLLPTGVAHFGARLEDIVETKNGRLTLKFNNGFYAEADAVIGCDGIKSRTRQILLGSEHPSAKPVYTHKYAYRGLIPTEKAVSALGEDMACNAFMHMGKNGHTLTFPVSNGKFMNVVAFKTNGDDWPNESRLTLPSTKSEALADFREFNGSIPKILSLLNDNLERWAIYDLGENPLPTYYKGRICLIGDAAHASSPHHGAGAGLGIEDAAVLSELLASAINRTGDRSSKSSLAHDVEAAFAIFDSSRRERTQWLVQSSRRVGDLYEWRVQGIGDDTDKIYEELKWRCEKIWDGDVNVYIESANHDLQTRLKSDSPRI